jgi:integrase
MDKFKEKSRSRFVLPDEMPRLMLAMEHESNELVRDFVKLALYTGARRSNVMSMQWPDVHLERKEWNIERTKNGEPQTVLLTPEAIEVLERRKQLAQGSKSLFVFPGSGKTDHLVEPRGAWERMLSRSTALGLVEALAEKATAKTFDYQLALEEAVDFPVQTIERYTPLAEKLGLHLQHYEMRDLKIHDLRRTLGSWLASSGTSLPIIGKVLNHKTPEATKVYARLIVAPVRNAMEEATAAMRRTGEV